MVGSMKDKYGQDHWELIGLGWQSFYFGKSTLKLW